MDVRPVRPDEIEALSHLTVEAYLTVPGASEWGEYLHELADVESRAASTLVLVAVSDDGVVGGVTYIDAPGEYGELAPGEAGVRHLAVAPAARRQGVGSALVTACIDRACAAGKQRVSLFTLSVMTSAQRLYERIGFYRCPARDWLVGDEVRLLCYLFELSPANYRDKTSPGGETGRR